MSWSQQLHCCGGVYTVNDGLIRLLPAGKRQKHPTRPFLVLSSTEIVLDNDWPTVVGCPLSTSDEWNTEYDVRLRRGDGGVDKDCWVRVTAIQPIEKKSLDFYKGEIGRQSLHEVRAALTAYLGMI
jgi:mRNA-degrading endonuclease toxin of MazEF toxin-antitoxin module